MIKEKIKADLYSYAKRIQELERENQFLRNGLSIAQQDESARTGRRKTKFDKYLKVE